MIRRIPDESRDIIKSSIYSRGDFICSLLNESIKRNASKITISILPQLGFSVTDDGQGFDFSTETISNSILDSLGAVSVVTVTSCDQKVFLQGPVKQASQLEDTSALTTVSCQSLYYNVPVKRKYALQHKDYEQIIWKIWVWALPAPQVEVSISSPGNATMQITPAATVVDRSIEMLEYYKCFGQRVELSSASGVTVKGALSEKSPKGKVVQVLLYNNSLVFLKRLEKGLLQNWNYVLVVDSYAQEELSQESLILDLLEQWFEGKAISTSKKRVSKKRVLEAESKNDVSEENGGDSTFTTLTRFSSFRTICQLDKRFILVVAQLKDPTMICIDQHAAHERILNDHKTNQVIENASKNVSEVTELSPPLYLSLDMKLLLKHECSLQKWGLCFFDGGYLSHVPLMAREMDPFQLDLDITEFLDVLESGVSDNALPPFMKPLIASWACRNAIKFGDVLTLKECHDMVEKLLKTKLPFQCAHGRPSMVPLALI